MKLLNIVLCLVLLVYGFRTAVAQQGEQRAPLSEPAIAFDSKGLNAIEDILVRRFCVDNENIFTFCLSEPSEADRSRFQCHWLVGMSTKATGQLRIGCGSYDWHFDGHGKVAKLVIKLLG